MLQEMANLKFQNQDTVPVFALLPGKGCDEDFHPLRGALLTPFPDLSSQVSVCTGRRPYRSYSVTAHGENNTTRQYGDKLCFLFFMKVSGCCRRRLGEILFVNRGSGDISQSK